MDAHEVFTEILEGLIPLGLEYLNLCQKIWFLPARWALERFAPVRLVCTVANTAHSGAPPPCPIIAAALMVNGGAEVLQRGGENGRLLRRRSALGLATRPSI
jgi:hypothetical protein